MAPAVMPSVVLAVASLSARVLVTTAVPAALGGNLYLLGRVRTGRWYGSFRAVRYSGVLLLVRPSPLDVSLIDETLVRLERAAFGGALAVRDVGQPPPEGRSVAPAFLLIELPDFCHLPCALRSILAAVRKALVSRLAITANKSPVAQADGHEPESLFLHAIWAYSVLRQPAQPPKFSLGCGVAFRHGSQCAGRHKGRPPRLPSP
mmetsp:Transcript_110348/g.329983  ORF Transcript_110348/g.329983 Transcript_110348/m.329983 type:complete len:205 (+) Transcript_110348:567-1181(+)